MSEPLLEKRHLSITTIFDKEYFKENEAYEVFDGVCTNIALLKQYNETFLIFTYTDNHNAHEFTINLRKYDMDGCVITKLVDKEGI